jgi:putative methylase
VKQRTLEMRLQSLKGFESPRADLEQYPTPARVAADMLYTAHALGDIEGRGVIDLGCGTGILAIGACLLGAGPVHAADIDEGAISVARANAEMLGCDIAFVCSEIGNVGGRFDTCVMNPPFGSQSRHADLPFLDKAMELAGTVYSLHNSCTSDFLRERAGKAGWSVTHEKDYELEIRHTFGFHTRERASFPATMLRMVRR